MIDIKVSPETYRSTEIMNLEFQLSDNITSDGLTNSKLCTSLWPILDSGQLHKQVEQWVKRPNLEEEEEKMSIEKTTRPLNPHSPQSPHLLW